jgi:hypothetical protein
MHVEQPTKIKAHPVSINATAIAGRSTSNDIQDAKIQKIISDKKVTAKWMPK